MKRIRIGTRGSKLALWQATRVAEILQDGGYDAEIVVIRTTGDQRVDVPLSAIGGKGLFLKEIEESLEAGKIDIAVHSLKDVPTMLASQFHLSAHVERADPRDAWIHARGGSIRAMSTEVIGTSSPRRRAQLLARHPQLTTRDVRGNVDTRMTRLRSGEYDAIVLAAAGLGRLGRTSEITEHFDVEQMVPSAGQGIVSVERLRVREDLLEVDQLLNDEGVQRMADAERGVLEEFDSRLDCYSAVAVHAEVDSQRMTLHTFISDHEGRDAVRIVRSAPLEDIAALIRAVAAEMKDRGALELLSRSSASAPEAS